MYPRSSLDALGRFFESELQRAWELFEEAKFDEAYNLSRRYLLEPAISDVHSAGFHMILGHSPGLGYEHARQAVHLYKHLLDGMEVPTGTRRAVDDFLHDAHKTSEERSQEVADNAEAEDEAYLASIPDETADADDDVLGVEDAVVKFKGEGGASISGMAAQFEDMHVSDNTTTSESGTSSVGVSGTSGAPEMQSSAGGSAPSGDSPPSPKLKSP